MKMKKEFRLKVEIFGSDLWEAAYWKSGGEKASYERIELNANKLLKDANKIIKKIFKYEAGR